MSMYPTYIMPQPIMNSSSQPQPLALHLSASQSHMHFRPSHAHSHSHNNGLLSTTSVTPSSAAPAAAAGAAAPPAAAAAGVGAGAAAPSAGSNVVGGRYALKHKIGAGSFGEIYLGVDIQTNKRFAVKMESLSSKYPVLRSTCMNRVWVWGLI